MEEDRIVAVIEGEGAQGCTGSQSDSGIEGGKCGKTTQSFRGNKYKKEHNLKRGDVKAIDSRRYVTV